MKVRYHVLHWESTPSETVRIEVLDAESKQPVPGAEVSLSLPSGLMIMSDATGLNEVVEFRLSSSSYIRSLYEKYNATVSFNGYFKVYKAGYKAFYSYEVETSANLEVFLEPQRALRVREGRRGADRVRDLADQSPQGLQICSDIPPGPTHT